MMDKRFNSAVLFYLNKILSYPNIEEKVARIKDELNNATRLSEIVVALEKEFTTETLLFVINKAYNMVEWDDFVKIMEKRNDGKTIPELAN